MTEDQHIARAAAALDDPGVRREAPAPRAVDPLREAAKGVLRVATEPMVDAAFNALPPDAHGTIGSGEMYRVLEAALAAAPQPAPMDREALVDFIYKSGQAGRERWAWAIADALLAAGLRLPGAVQQLADLGQQADQLDETLAWSVQGSDGKVDPETIREMRIEAESYMVYPGDRVVRVAICVVEGGDDAA